MLIYPDILLQLWSDYHSTTIDLPALVNAHLKRNPSVAPARTELRLALDKEVENEWTQYHIEAATAKLSDWCVRHNRYFRNVAWEPGAGETRELWPTLLEPQWWQVWPSGKNATWRYGVTRFPSGKLREFDLVLIDAPICLDAEAAAGDAYMCDAPLFARRGDDAKLALMLSETVRQRLTAYASSGADWIPFCRTLGIVRNQAREQAIQVLQVSVRKPRFPDPGWSIKLIEEAHEIKAKRAYSSDKDAHFNAWIGQYRSYVKGERAKHSGFDNAALAAARGPDFASEMLRSGSYYATNMLKDENNPYRKAESFWMALASILPAWRKHFSLSGPEVDALLRKFDASYDEAWKSSMQDLAISGLFRFTPEVMDRIRTRIAGLKIELT